MAVTTSRVVEHLDVIEDIAACFLARERALTTQYSGSSPNGKAAAQRIDNRRLAPGASEAGERRKASALTEMLGAIGMFGAISYPKVPSASCSTRSSS